MIMLTPQTPHVLYCYLHLDCNVWFEQGYDMGTVYQRGSVRKVTRRDGTKAWEWRYRINGKMKQETFPVGKFKTEGDLWIHLGPAIERLNSKQEHTTLVATVETVAKRYKKEYLPDLAQSTRERDTLSIDKHILPKWGQLHISQLKPFEVEPWLNNLKVRDHKGQEHLMSGESKSKIKRMLKQLYDRAMYWEMIPLVGTNPMSLVKVKGATIKVKERRIATVEDVNRLIAELEPPYSAMVLLAAGLGLRVSEVLALRWEDLDWKKETVSIRRKFTHGELGEPKSKASRSTLPLGRVLLQALVEIKEDEGWLFPSSKTGGPRWSGMIAADHIKPALARLGLPLDLGFHSLRHSYKSWLDSSDATLVEIKDMMRHASLPTSELYGGTPVETMRPRNEAVTSRLVANLKPKQPVATQ